MSSKVITILLGAGAAKPWGGKDSNELTTHLISESKFRTRNNENCLSFLFNHLIKKYTDGIDKINFEILLNSLEYLFEFYRTNERKSKLINYSPDWPSLFEITSEVESIIPEYSTDSRRWTEGLTDITYVNNNFLGRITQQAGYEKSRFVYELYHDTIENIKSTVQSYSKNKKFHERLEKYFQFLKKNGYIIRLYSLNYDNIPLSCHPSETFFNGFNFHSTSNRNDIGIFDYEKVILNGNCDCFYNLHGSINYDCSFYKYSGLKQNDRVVYLNNKSEREHSNRDASIKREILGTTIITGAQKTLKINSLPYFAFFNRFLQDCLGADKLICIGYSFSDYHVNEIIRNTFESNKNLEAKLINITKFAPSADLNGEFHPTKINANFRNIISDNQLRIKKDLLKDGWYVSEQFYNYSEGFEKFLIDEIAWEFSTENKYANIQ